MGTQLWSHPRMRLLTYNDSLSWRLKLILLSSPVSRKLTKYNINQHHFRLYDSIGLFLYRIIMVIENTVMNFKNLKRRTDCILLSHLYRKTLGFNDRWSIHTFLYMHYNVYSWSISYQTELPSEDIFTSIATFFYSLLFLAAILISCSLFLSILFFFLKHS